jgi:hypothetical protein
VIPHLNYTTAVTEDARARLRGNLEKRTKKRLFYRRFECVKKQKPPALS